MRISHPCPSCGADLRRIRAVRSRGAGGGGGLGGVTIVVCPRCGLAVARRTDRIAARRRAAVRLAKSLLALVLQLAALTAFVAILFSVCDPYTHTILRGRAPGGVQYLTLGVIAVSLGAWLSAAFTHWSRWAVWPAFAGVVTALLALLFVIVPLVGIFARELGLPVPGPPVRLDRAVAGVVILTAIMVVAAAGIPVGTAARAAVERVRVMGWRARRRRMRNRSLR